MTTATVASPTTPPLDVAALLIEAFPRAIVRRLRYADYGSLAANEQAAARRQVTVCEGPASAAPELTASALLELGPITPEIAAKNRALLEDELLRLTRDRRGGGGYV